MSDRRQHQPLTADEVAMAQRLRALPLASLSAQVDTALLAASRVQQIKRPRPLWVAGFAAAASLVLVIGLVSRLPTNMQPSAKLPLPAAREGAPSAPAVDARRDRAAPKAQSRQISEPVASPATQAPEIASDAGAGKAQPEAVQVPAPAPIEQTLDKISVSGTRLADDAVEDGASAASEAKAALGAAASDHAVTQAAERAETATPARAAGVPTKAETAPAPVVYDSAAPMAIEAPTLPLPPPPPPVVSHAQEALPEPASVTGRISATARSVEVPSAELKAIRELLRAHQDVAASVRLRALMQQYPEWTVPDDLRGLLE